MPPLTALGLLLLALPVYLLQVWWDYFTGLSEAEEPSLRQLWREERGR